MAEVVLSTIATAPLANYPNGVFTSPAVDIPDLATDVEFDIAACTSLDPTIWPVGPTLSLRLFFSISGGPFVEDGGFNDAAGGIHKNRFGQEITQNTYRTGLPVGVTRQMRVRFTIANGPLRTRGDAKWLAID